MSIMTDLFSGKGRLRRRDYWLYSLAFAAIGFGLEYAAYRLWGSGGTFFVQIMLLKSGHMDGFLFAYFAICLLMLWTQTAVLAKRWHDRNRSGYLALLMTLLSCAPLGFDILRNRLHIPHLMLASVLFNIVFFLFGLWCLIECGFLDGTRGANRYGASPKHRQDPSAVF